MVSHKAAAIIQKTRDAYNKIAGAFSGTRYDVWPELEQFKPLVKNGQSILDWGCGNGRLLLMLKDYDIRYFGLDQSQALLKIAKKKHADLIKQKKAAFYCTAHKEKKFPDNYFDLAFMIASFHHLPDKKTRLALLKKTLRELKPGGKLCMTNWNLKSDWSKAKMQKDWKKIDENNFLIPWKNQEGKILAERYYHHFTPDELSSLLEEVGYIVERIDYSGLAKWNCDKSGRNLTVVATKPSVDNKL